MNTVTPFLWFNGKVQEAAKFYASVFKGAKILDSSPMSATLRLKGQTLILFNGGPHYKLTPAFSLYVDCKTQKEVDYYYSKLVKGGEKSRCGWLVDKFGVSWQVIPDILGPCINDPDPAKARRAMQAMLKMQKIDIKALKKAHAGR